MKYIMVHILRGGGGTGIEGAESGGRGCRIGGRGGGKRE